MGRACKYDHSTPTHFSDTTEILRCSIHVICSRKARRVCSILLVLVLVLVLLLLLLLIKCKTHSKAISHCEFFGLIRVLICFFFSKIKYDHETPKSHTADQPTTPGGRDAARKLTVTCHHKATSSLVLRGMNAKLETT